MRLLSVLLLCLGLLAAPAVAQVTVSNPQSNQAASASSVAIASYDSGAAADDVLVCATAAEDNPGAHPTGVTFGATGLTASVSHTQPDPPSATTNYIKFWYLDAPSGTETVTATWSGAQAEVAIGCLVLANAKSGGPTDTNQDGGGSITTLDIVQSVTAADSVTIGAFSSGQNLASLTSSQTGTGQTDRAEENLASSHFLLSSKAEGSAGSSTSGATGNAGSNRLVGVLGTWEEAPAAGGIVVEETGSNVVNTSATVSVTGFDVACSPGDCQIVACGVNDSASEGSTFTSVVLDPGGGDEASFESIGDFSYGASSTWVNVSAWRLVDSDIPASGTYTITATKGLSGADAILGVIMVSGVSQGSVVDTDQFDNDGVTASGTVTTASDGAILINCAAADLATTYTHYANGTEWFDQQGTGSGATGAGSYEIRASAGGATVSATAADDPTHQTLVSIEIAPFVAATAQPAAAMMGL